MDQKIKAKRVLVFDLGGGTFDVSLLTIERGEFRVLATSGDTHLGGADFDQRVMDWFLKRFKMKHERDLSTSKKALAQLRKEAENAKIVLSAEKSVKIEIENIMDGINFKETLTRAKFDELNKDLFKKTAAPIKTVRCAFFGRNSHSRVPLGFTPLLRLKRTSVCPMAFLSGVHYSYRLAL
jgi:heat shock protein 5